MASEFIPPKPSYETPWNDRDIQARTGRFAASITLERVQLELFVCIYSRFPYDNPYDNDKDLVVRIPVPTIADRHWDMIRSEAATLAYIEKKHPSIPVPRVIAHGKDEQLTDDSTTTQCFFIITTRIPGKPRDDEILEGLDFEQRLRLASQLASKFPQTGSQYPEPDGVSEYVGRHLSRSNNYFTDRDGLPRKDQESCNTVRESASQHVTNPNEVHPAVLRSFKPEERAQLSEEFFAKMGSLIVVSLSESFQSPFWQDEGGFMLSKGSLDMNTVMINGDGNLRGLTN
ncbi:Protein kinase-like domain protein [Cordyceps fumosorosea ARSEF 2679]|uniref:Protein kinase-like domain protein n=1 Tax=Cordyceps fumosorosea (strain ARSEF 2679) TaxID=1081104 RepID=A0A167YB30_CORFA|nr:Protein kinase-like domain protein [Cordyceps fumosorosea ARSEF 2679]OAA66095.1 Protein kinase-like domain protein [Cordyceps fumosorosea ARSEF 2679]